MLAVAGVFIYGLKDGTEALAAQLAVDHVKCFEFRRPRPSFPTPSSLGREWAEPRGWTVKVPESEPVEQLELLGIRRCISTEGAIAHLMYKWRGQPLSVYMLKQRSTRASSRHRDGRASRSGRDHLVAEGPDLRGRRARAARRKSSTSLLYVQRVGGIAPSARRQRTFTMKSRHDDSLIDRRGRRNRRWRAHGAALLGPTQHVTVDPETAGRRRTRSGACEADKQANLDFTVKDMNGAKVRLADYKGKVILVNFWATWCAPCKVEIPGFLELYSSTRTRASSSSASRATTIRETLREFAAEWKINYPMIVGRDEEKLMDAYGPLYGYPTSVLVGRERRRLRSAMSGPRRRRSWSGRSRRSCSMIP